MNATVTCTHRWVIPEQGARDAACDVSAVWRGARVSLGIHRGLLDRRHDGRSRPRSEGRPEEEVVMTYEIVQSYGTGGEWRVEGIDYENEGLCLVVIFSGYEAEQFAREYYQWVTAGAS